MKNIFKIIAFLFFTTNSYSCALCALDIPNVHIKTIVTNEQNSTSFDITWEFDEKFLSMLTQYDENNNGIFDTNEQDNITKSLEDYLHQFNYLTNIIYVKKDVKLQKEMFETIKNVTSKMVFQGKTMSYNFHFSLNFPLQEEYRLFVDIFDKGSNFNFIIKDFIVKNYDKTKIIKIDGSRVNVYLYDYKLPVKEVIKPKQEEVKIIIEDRSFLTILASKLESYKQKIETLLKDIKQNNTISSYFWLLLFSFIYGVLHAIGPGHGKSLVGAYFLSENRSTMKALSISALIGVVHTFSALILTFTVYYLLSLLFSNIITDIEKIATKISAVVIIGIGLYLLFKKYNYKKSMIFSVNKPNHHHTHSCSCGSCSTKSTDLGVIISAGIVPCPGTVTIFLFTISLGVVFVGFLSAIFMSIGMSLVIFITAYLSSKVRKKTTSNGKLVKFFEYGSLVFILFLGILLLFS